MTSEWLTQVTGLLCFQENVCQMYNLNNHSILSVFFPSKIFFCEKIGCFSLQLKYHVSAFPGDSHPTSIVAEVLYTHFHFITQNIKNTCVQVLKFNKGINMLLINITTNILKWNWHFSLCYFIFLWVCGGEENNYYDSLLPQPWFVIWLQ